jgi:glycosyltransferase involved in cell wall biosynthesis
MSSAMPRAQPVLSVLIKALNEEARIAACLDAVLAATQGIDTEIVLADSISTDRTVAIASQYPVRIVQFQKAEDRGCGAAVQLAYQYARGAYLYVLDADMILQPDFIKVAMARLLADPKLAGVGGLIVDKRVNTLADKRRVEAARKQESDVFVPELGGGGLYRRNAIEEVGYLSNRWLAAFEEADLGARLSAAGWRLLRLKQASVAHEGHQESNFKMIRRLWRNGRARSTGVFLRAALGKPWWPQAARKQMHVLLVPFLHIAPLLASAMAPSFGLALSAWLMVWLLQCGLLALKKRSVRAAAWSFFFWHYFAVAAAVGFLKAPRDPLLAIDSKERTADVRNT